MEDTYEVDSMEMNIKRLAEVAGVDRTTLYRAIRTGKLKTRSVEGRFGTEQMISEEALSKLWEPVRARRTFTAHWIMQVGPAIRKELLTRESPEFSEELKDRWFRCWQPLLEERLPPDGDRDPAILRGTLVESLARAKAELAQGESPGPG